MSQFFYIKKSMHNNIIHNYKITICFLVILLQTTLSKELFFTQQ
jgi:hypothetical protein